MWSHQLLASSVRLASSSQGFQPVQRVGGTGSSPGSKADTSSSVARCSASFGPWRMRSTDSRVTRMRPPRRNPSRSPAGEGAGEGRPPRGRPGPRPTTDPAPTAMPGAATLPVPSWAGPVQVVSGAAAVVPRGPQRRGGRGRAATGACPYGWRTARLPPSRAAARRPCPALQGGAAPAPSPPSPNSQHPSPEGGAGVRQPPRARSTISRPFPGRSAALRPPGVRSPLRR
jgi:hypothetical protein